MRLPVGVAYLGGSGEKEKTVMAACRCCHACIFRVHLSIRSKYPHLVCSLVVVPHLLDALMDGVYPRLLLIPPS